MGGFAETRIDLNLLDYKCSNLFSLSKILNIYCNY